MNRGEATPAILRRRCWRASALIALSVAVLAIAATLTLGALDQNITQVSVTGRFQRVSPVEVEQAVKARVRDMGLVSVDLAAVRRAVEQLPWVDSATVERQWPRALSIRVVEQVAAARWGANGLLNTRGELFISEARHIPPELPRLSGPARQRKPRWRGATSPRRASSSKPACA